MSHKTHLHLVTETATNISTTHWVHLLEPQFTGPQVVSDMAGPHDRVNGGTGSFREAANTKTEVMNAKNKTRIEFWNVQTMYETGRLAQITLQMQRYNLTLRGRWTDSGEMTTASGETLLYSGCTDGQHREG